jgi:gamma-glutamyl:cysteine ligase YbdK (ATP-grasp superfamily)
MIIILLLLFTISCNGNSSDSSSSSIYGDQINFAAIFNPPPHQELKQDMFEKTVDFQTRVQKYHADRMQLFDESLAKFNQAARVNY